MKLVFISGAYRNGGYAGVETNIQHARKEAVKLWQMGYAVICPHLNTAHFDGLCPDDIWLKGDLEILKRCDVIYMLNNWHNSQGAKAELELAQQKGLEVIYED